MIFIIIDLLQKFDYKIDKTNLIFYTMKNKTNYDLDEYWGIKY